MAFLRLLVCAILALALVLGITLFLVEIFDQEEYAIPVIPLDTTTPADTP